MSIYRYATGGVALFTAPAPAVPSGFAVTPRDSNVTIEWDDNTETYFDRYEYRIDGGAPVGVGAISRVDITLTNDVEYDFEVRAISNNEATSAWSTVISAIPAAPYVLDISSLGFGHRMIVPGGDAGLGDTDLPTLIYLPGFNGTAAGAAAGAWFQKIVDTLRRPMVIPQISSGWGNAADRVALESFLTAWGASEWGNDITSVDLFGASMGGATAATWAKAHIEDVRSVSLCGPVSDIEQMSLTSIYDDDIATAYGGAYSEATHGADHNPVTMAAAGVFDGLRWKTWYCESDPICLQATVEEVLDNVPNSQRSMMPGGGHNMEMQRDISNDIAAHIAGADTDTRTSRLPGGDVLVDFWRDGTFTLPSYPLDVRVLVLSGGGGTGGHFSSFGAAGAGGGGALIEDLTYTVTGPTAVVVGRGGMGGGQSEGDGFEGENGGESIFGSITAAGGGGGGGAGAIWPSGTDLARCVGVGGGSGGGGGGLELTPIAGGNGSPGGDGAATSSTFAWKCTGAGGGAGTGAVRNQGGDGIASDITGLANHYGGGGGGGGKTDTGVFSAPGLGGGGNGGHNDLATLAEPGVDGLGGGAGGSIVAGHKNGGHGRVIVRYSPPPKRQPTYS